MKEQQLLFEQNYQKLEKFAGWTTAKQIVLFIASAYTARNEEINIEKWKNVLEVIKKESSFFSTLRMNTLMQYMYVMQLENEENRAKKLSYYTENFELLRKAKLANSPYTTLAALFLNDDERFQHAQRARIVYEEMRKKHMFLTSYEDIPMAVLLASKETNQQQLGTTMRAYYDALHAQKLTIGNNLQTLSQILALISPTYNEQLVYYIVAIKEQLEHAGIKVKQSYYIQLGFLASAQVNEEQLTQLIEMFNTFKKEKYFKWYKDQAFSCAVQQFLPITTQQTTDYVSIVSLEYLLQMQYMLMATTTFAVMSSSNTSE